MSDFGVRCRDASGNITLDTSFIVARYIKTYTFIENQEYTGLVGSGVTSDNSFLIVNNIPGIAYNDVYDSADYGTSPLIYLDTSGNIVCEKIDAGKTFKTVVGVYSYI